MTKGKFGIFDIILAVVVVAGIGLNVYGFGFRSSGAEANQNASPTASQTAAQTEKPTAVTRSPETTPAQASTPEPVETEQPKETPAPTSQAQNSYESYRGYADGETPSIGDFFWFTEDVKWDGLPKGITAITEFSTISGYWKAYTEDAHVMSDEEFLKWFNTEISGDANNVKFTYHTKNFTGFDAGNTIDISSWDGESYDGRFSGGQLVVGDIGTKGEEISIKDFYTLDGKQYAIGEIKYISGEKEYIALVRP